MNLPWTAQQREWLGALGYSVLVTLEDDGGAGIETLADEPPQALAMPVATATREGRPADRGAMLGIPEPRPMPPVRVELPATVDVPPAGGNRIDLSDPLYRALLRATAQRTPREGQAMLDTLAVDLGALRGDATSKRVLWQGLRSARKATRG